jgi:molecular chaperone DnaJ
VRVRGRGIKPAKGDAGDLLVTFEVVVPKKVTGDQRAAVEALAEKLDDNPRAHLGV